MLRRLPASARAGALVCAIATISSLAFTASPVAADPQDDLAAKRQQAEALEQEIRENGARISALDEDFNEARLEVERATAGIAEAEQRLKAAGERTAEIRSRLASRAAEIYTQGHAGGPLPMLESGDITEAASRAMYASAAAEQDGHLIDELTVATEDLEVRQAELGRTRDDAARRQGELETARREIEQAQADQQALLDGVQGEIADLVAEIEAQRRAEEEAAARAAAEAQRQEAERAAAAARERAARASAAAGEDGSSTARDGTGSAPVPTAAPAPNPNAQTAVDTAMAQLGKPYRYAASGPDTFDCSGLTMYAWAAAGVGLPHSSRAQFASLPHVAQDALAPGDLVFYGSPIHHVGIYIGGGQYVHAPQTGDVVKVSTIYRRDWAGAARPG